MSDAEKRVRRALECMAYRGPCGVCGQCAATADLTRALSEAERRGRAKGLEEVATRMERTGWDATWVRAPATEPTPNDGEGATV